MKVSETYILHARQYENIKWLYDFVTCIDGQRVRDTLQYPVIKIYRTGLFYDEWFLETPHVFEDGSWIFADLRQIPTEIVNVDDLLK